MASNMTKYHVKSRCDETCIWKRI